MHENHLVETTMTPNRKLLTGSALAVLAVLLVAAASRQRGGLANPTRSKGK